MTKNTNQENQRSDVEEVTQNKKRRFGLLTILSLFFVLGVASLTWILKTQTGAQLILHGLSSVSAGQLHIQGVEGNLSSQLHIDEFKLSNAQSNIVAKNIQLDWQLFALLSRELKINSLEISSLRISSAPSNTKLVLPKNLQLPLQVQVKKIAIGKIFINTLDPSQVNKVGTSQVYLSNFLASYTGNDAQHIVKGGVNSDWGKVNLDAEIANQAPFTVKGNFTYKNDNRTRLKTQMNSSIPEVLVRGKITGNAGNIKIHAIAAPVNSSLMNDKSMQGDLTLDIKPFNSQMLHGAKILLKNFNPSSLHQNAPNALLNVDINVRNNVENNLKNKDTSELLLSGKIDVQNAIPLSIDKNGLPFSSIVSTIALSEKHIELSQAKVLLGSGSIIGNIAVHWQGSQLQKLNSSLALSDINLLSLDSRLHKTSIQGTVRAQNESPQKIDIQANLKDPKASLKLSSHLLFNSDHRPTKLRLDEFKLASVNMLNLSSFEGKGELSFEGREQFQFSGDIKQFDPSQWLAAPKANLKGNVELKGQMLPAMQLQASIPHLQGHIENQPLIGNAELFWEQGKSLSVQSFNFQLAENKMSANGKLGTENDILLIKVDAPNLSIFAPIVKDKLSGGMQFEAALKGKLNAPSGSVNIRANKLQIRENIQIGKLDGDFTFGTEQLALLKADLNIYDVKNIVPKTSVRVREEVRNENLMVEAIHVKVTGKNNAHIIDSNIHFNPSKILSFQASGGVDFNLPKLSWKGQLQKFSMGKLFQLQNPMVLMLAQNKIQLGVGQFEGEVGNIHLDSFEWSPGNTQTKGYVQQLKLFQLLDLVKLQKLFSGDIKLNADWQLQFQDSVKGFANIQRASGDIWVSNADVNGQTIALGLDAFSTQLRFGGVIAGSDAEQISANFEAKGSRLGQWKIELASQLRYAAGQWQISNESPLNGNLQAKIPDLQWLGSLIHPDFAIKGNLDIDAKIAGELGHPRYQAKLEGKELELAFASEGLLLPNGTLSAQVSDEFVKLTHLKFSNAITFIPKHEKLQDLEWRGQVGDLVASGEVDLKKQAGEILVQWNQFPLLQRKDRWLVTTGQAKITQLDKTWSLLGKMKADGAYFQLPKLPPPSLSSDVLVTRGVDFSSGMNNLDSEPRGFKTKLDMTLDMGSNFVFVGRGLDTPLTGSLRLRSTEGSPITASGSILAKGGKYEGYGQQLEIERGILNFQGSPSNPSLNIRALRKGLPVEAGVDVNGSVSNPIVRLVSEPNVPDSEKLSWLVLGRESDQVSTNDASLLLSAAGAIFGGDGTRNIPREFVQKLGFDEFSIGPAESAGSSKLPSQTIAGATAVGSSSNDQVVKISARLKPGIVFSVEKGISDASGALKLSWLLSRRVKLVGRYGTDSSVDAKYTFSFN